MQLLVVRKQIFHFAFFHVLHVDQVPGLSALEFALASSREQNP